MPPVPRLAGAGRLSLLYEVYPLFVAGRMTHGFHDWPSLVTWMLGRWMPLDNTYDSCFVDRMSLLLLDHDE